MHGHFECRIVVGKLKINYFIRFFFPVWRHHSVGSDVLIILCLQSGLLWSICLYIHYVCLDLVGVFILD